jgi:two-component system CheB/CheR fusion protein
VVAEDGVEIRPNSVYVLPADAIISVAAGRLALRKSDSSRRERKPIDILFSSLAIEHGDYAASVVLSGGDGDGTLGTKAIKERGGLTMAQVAEWLIADQIADALRDGGFGIVGPVGQVGPAFDLLRTERVNVALIDININGDRTFRLADALAKASVPFAFLSGYSKADLPRNLRERPLLQKPVDANPVCRCVRSLLSA